MTAHVADRTDPDEPADDATWWDRHGWDGGVPAGARLVGPPLATDGAALDERLDGHLDGDVEEDPDRPQPAGVRWSTLLLSVALLGGLITLPVLGFAGGFGRVLAPTAWVFVGLVVGLRLSDREPTWDLADPHRVEPLVGWVLAYATTALIGLRGFEGVAGWWVPGTVVTAVLPFVVARLRPAAALARAVRRVAARRRATG